MPNLDTRKASKIGLKKALHIQEVALCVEAGATHLEKFCSVILHQHCALRPALRVQEKVMCIEEKGSKPSKPQKIFKLLSFSLFSKLKTPLYITTYPLIKYILSLYPLILKPPSLTLIIHILPFIVQSSLVHPFTRKRLPLIPFILFQECTTLDLASMDRRKTLMMRKKETLIWQRMMNLSSMTLKPLIQRLMMKKQSKTSSFGKRMPKYRL